MLGGARLTFLRRGEHHSEPPHLAATGNRLIQSRRVPAATGSRRPMIRGVSGDDRGPRDRSAITKFSDSCRQFLPWQPFG